MNAYYKKMFQEGFRFEISDELLERFIGQMDEICLKDNEILIPYGKIDTNLYLIKSGIVRNCYFKEENEKVYGFSIPGAPLMSYHSLLMSQPAVFQFVACGEAEVLKISKAQIDELMKSSYEFCQLMLAIYSVQSYLLEFKHTTITGDAKTRYLWMTKHRPEVVTKVSTKLLASYLDIAPAYLSYLKRITLKKGK